MAAVLPDIEIRKRISRELIVYVKKWSSWTKVAKNLGIKRSTMTWRRQNDYWTWDDIRYLASERVIEEIYNEKEEVQKNTNKQK